MMNEFQWQYILRVLYMIGCALVGLDIYLGNYGLAAFLFMSSLQLLKLL